MGIFCSQINRNNSSCPSLPISKDIEEVRKF